MSPAEQIPRVSVSLDTLYYGFYVEGLRRVLGRVRWCRPPLPHVPGMAIEVDGKRIYVCAQDPSDIYPEPLAWCDVYGKVNLRGDPPPKVVAIGPSFGTRAWSLAASGGAAVAAFAYGSRRRPRDTMADLYRQRRYRVPESRLVPGPSDSRYVFFAATIWQKEASTNLARATFLRTVRARPDLTVEGGFAPRQDGVGADFADLLAPSVDYRSYLDRTRRSAFVFNTPAVLGCHGWKLAEFLALGKAIISTALTNRMPAPFEPGRHFHLVEPTPESIGAAVDALADDDYRRHLEHQARRYYVDHLAPEAVIRRLLTHR